MPRPGMCWVTSSASPSPIPSFSASVTSTISTVLRIAAPKVAEPAR